MSADHHLSGLSRRLFLGGSGLAATALAAPVLAQGSGAVGRPRPVLDQPPPLPDDRKLGVAVVGLGKLALGEVIPAFADCRACKLAALVSGNREKAMKVAAAAGLPQDAIYDYENYDRMAQDDRIDIVYIILPNGLHAEYTIRALKAGKHVLCEKPMATTIEDGEAMIREAAAAKRKLMVAYRTHYEPYNLEAMRLLREKTIGDIRLLVTDNGRPADPKDPSDQWRLDPVLAGGGPLMDIGIYGVNGARYLTGEEPVELRAWTHKPAGDSRFDRVEDVVAWQFRFPSGAIAQGSTSYSYAGISRFDVLGTDGRLTMDPATNYRGMDLRVSGKKGEQRREITEINQFAREMDHIAEAVAADRPVTTPGEEGLQDIRLMLAIYEAMESGQSIKTDWGYRRAVDPVDAANRG